MVGRSRNSQPVSRSPCPDSLSTCRGLCDLRGDGENTVSLHLVGENDVTRLFLPPCKTSAAAAMELADSVLSAQYTVFLVVWRLPLQYRRGWKRGRSVIKGVLPVVSRTGFESPVVTITHPDRTGNLIPVRSRSSLEDWSTRTPLD
jgi:hypothetical protein